MQTLLTQGVEIVKQVYSSVRRASTPLPMLAALHCADAHARPVLPCSELPNLDLIIPALLRVGVEGLHDECKLTPGPFEVPPSPSRLLPHLTSRSSTLFQVCRSSLCWPSLPRPSPRSLTDSRARSSRASTSTTESERRLVWRSSPLLRLFFFFC